MKADGPSPGGGFEHENPQGEVRGHDPKAGQSIDLVQNFGVYLRLQDGALAQPGSKPDETKAQDPKFNTGRACGNLLHDRIQDHGFRSCGQDD